MRDSIFPEDKKEKCPVAVSVHNSYDVPTTQLKKVLKKLYEISIKAKKPVSPLLQMIRHNLKIIKADFFDPESMIRFA